MKANPMLWAVQQGGPYETIVTHGQAVVVLYKEKLLGGYVRETESGEKQPFMLSPATRGETTRMNKFFRERGIDPKDADYWYKNAIHEFMQTGTVDRQANPSVEWDFTGDKPRYTRVTAEEERRGRDNPAEGIRSYGPGKFDTYADKYVWEVSLDGADDELNDENGAWHGFLRHGHTMFTDDDPDLETLTDEERELIQESEIVIVSESPDGFVSVRYFDNTQEGEEAWGEYEEYEDVEG